MEKQSLSLNNCVKQRKKKRFNLVKLEIKVFKYEVNRSYNKTIHESDRTKNVCTLT